MSGSNGESLGERLYTIDEVKEIVSPIARRYDVRRMWLFGSYARGEATATWIFGSDDKCGLIKYSGLWLALEEALGRKIDLVSSRSIKTFPIYRTIENR